MSGNLNALILERAVKLWEHPGMRRRGTFGRPGEGHCALGVLMRARLEITGDVAPVGPLDSWDATAALIGLSARRIMSMNDRGIIFGQRYLYWRMKRALKKARA